MGGAGPGSDQKATTTLQAPSPSGTGMFFGQPVTGGGLNYQGVQTANKMQMPGMMFAPAQPSSGVGAGMMDPHL